MIYAFKTRLSQRKSRYPYFFFILVLLSCFSLFTHIIFNPAYASVNSSNNFSLQPLIEFPTTTIDKNDWQQLIAHPINSQQYYVRNKQGQIYLIEQELSGNHAAKLQLLLDFNQLALTSSTVKTLNSFTLHPNFSLKDQQGFATFYTAHTEASNKNSPTIRIKERDAKLAVSFDGVITEWQLDLANPNQVNLSYKREVLRITLPNAKNGIKQLSFNPYVKSWNENFALLYISLGFTDSLSQFPLYSGAILRINPEKFGMKSFTVPETNPFLKDNNLHNGFYLVGAQHIQQFIWPDKNKEQLLISHQYQGSNKSVNNQQKYQWLSFAQGGEDWRESAPDKILYKNRKKIGNNQLLLYRGRNAPALHDKLLILNKNNKQWQLNSLSNSQQVRKSEVNIAQPQVEWQFKQELSASSQFQIYVNNTAELIFLQQDTGAIFELFQTNIKVNKTEQQSSNAPIYLFFIMVLTSLAGYGFYQIKVKKKSAKTLVRRQYADIKLNVEEQALDLFKRHQKSVEKSIIIGDINQCQILLGDNIIATVARDEKHGFSDQQEQSLRDIFNREHTEKMVDGKIRRISIAIIDNNKQNYMTCLYLRKGSDRITKKSYYQVIDDLIDWCWLIAQNINSENTGSRKARPKMSAAQKSESEHKLNDETPLHKQAAIIRPATHPVEAKSIKAVVNKD